MWKSVLNKFKIFPRKQISPNSNLIVVITGCDSGLGLLMAKAAHFKGLTVVAGVLQGVEGDGARHLKAVSNFHTPLHILELDVTNEKSVNNLKCFTKSLLNDNSDSILHAVVNNAGLMVMGDFEWQTKDIAERQWAVNVWGTWDVTRNLLWALRDAAKRSGHPRIINVNSHCGQQPLRTMSVYSATKAALRSWSESLRMELRFSGIQIVDYIPGRVVASNILANQNKYLEEMRNSFDSEQLNYYEKYFDEFSDYLGHFGTAPKSEGKEYEKELENIFIEALLVEKPCYVYKTEPWRYVLYYNLFKITPGVIKHWLMEKFLKFPSLKNSNKCN